MTRSNYSKHGDQGPMRRESAGGPAGRTAGAGSVAATAQDQLSFSVRYTLLEYTSFMWQHAGFLIRRRRIGRFATWWMLCKSTTAAALHFVLQGRGRHVYDFTIDAHGIIRSSGTGVTLVPWGDVSAIRRYSCGYMLVLARGTLPIPFRCLSASQAGAMDCFAVAVRAAR